MSIIYAVIECLSLIKDTRASRLGLRKILLSKLPFHQEGFSEKKSHLLYLWKVERIFTTCKIEYTDCLCLDFEQSIPFLVFINWGCIHLKKKKKTLVHLFSAKSGKGKMYTYPERYAYDVNGSEIKRKLFHAWIYGMIP